MVSVLKVVTLALLGWGVLAGCKHGDTPTQSTVEAVASKTPRQEYASASQISSYCAAIFDASLKTKCLEMQEARLPKAAFDSCQVVITPPNERLRCLTLIEDRFFEKENLDLCQISIMVNDRLDCITFVRDKKMTRQEREICAGSYLASPRNACIKQRGTLEQISFTTNPASAIAKQGYCSMFFNQPENKERCLKQAEVDWDAKGLEKCGVILPSVSPSEALKCISLVQGAYFQTDVLGYCDRVIQPADRLECLGATRNKEFADISACQGEYLPAGVISCVKRLKSTRR